LVVASASAFVAHAPRCVTSQAPRSASAKAVLSGLPDVDEPLDFRKEINELKVITEGLANNFTMLDQYFRDEISDLKPVTVVSTSRLLSLGTQETKAETETEQDPLAISAKDDTFPVCCSPLRPPPLRRARLSRRGVHHPDQSLPRLPLQSWERQMWLAQENGKLQLKNIASMRLPQAAFTPEAYRLYALIFIFHFLTSFFQHL
jgi:hypothetical protein